VAFRRWNRRTLYGFIAMSKATKRKILSRKARRETQQRNERAIQWEAYIRQFNESK
jgi:hypothetical protein